MTLTLLACLPLLFGAWQTWYFLQLVLASESWSLMVLIAFAAIGLWATGRWIWRCARLWRAGRVPCPFGEDEYVAVVEGGMVPATVENRNAWGVRAIERTLTLTGPTFRLELAQGQYRRTVVIDHRRRFVV